MCICMASCGGQGVPLGCIQCFWDKLQTYHNSDQDKAIIEAERMNECKIWALMWSLMQLAKFEKIMDEAETVLGIAC